MTPTFQALRVHPDGPRLESLQREELTPGAVTLAVRFSSLNYKDALAVTGKGKILKRFPLNAGIDCAGVVESSTDARFTPGQEVLVTGCGIGESFDGGYSEILRADAESVVPLPKGLNLRESMILGTAGFTAALALYRLEQNGQTREMGPILVTGASGGVGSFAVQILSQNNYKVHALSGKPEATEYLKSLGAEQVLAPNELNLGGRPLESARFGGAIDNVGGDLLARVLAHTQLWGNVASIGLAQSAELHTTVMPFILRGVSLLGISSNNCTRDVRLAMWRNLAGLWKPRRLQDVVTHTIGLKDLARTSEDLIARKIHGRVLVEVNQ